MACSPVPSFADLPDELIHEIAIRAPSLLALRQVVRFDVKDVAATKVARWFRSLLAETPLRVKPIVGDRVMCRFPAHLKRKPAFATVVGNSGYHHGRALWRIWLFDGSYVKVTARRIRPLEPWNDGVWGDSVGRTSALAAASVAREAATRATSAAMATLSSTASAAETALAVAVASAACTAAAAATSAATAAESSGSQLATGGGGVGASQVEPCPSASRGLPRVGVDSDTASGSSSSDDDERTLPNQSPLRLRPAQVEGPLAPHNAADPANHNAEATSLLDVARDMQEAVTANTFATPPAAHPGAGTHGELSRVISTGGLNRLHEAALAAADAAAEAAAATQGADAIHSVGGTLTVTAGTAAAAASAAANVVAAIEELAEARRNDLGQAGPAACNAASSAAADAIKEMGAAGRALNASWGTHPHDDSSSKASSSKAEGKMPVPHTSSSSTVEQAAAMVRSASAVMLAHHGVAGPGGDLEEAAAEMEMVKEREREKERAAALDYDFDASMSRTMSNASLSIDEDVVDMQERLSRCVVQ